MSRHAHDQEDLGEVGPGRAAASRAKGEADRGGPTQLLALQRSAGNRAVADLVTVQRAGGPRGTRRRPAGRTTPRTKEQEELYGKARAGMRRQQAMKKKARNDKYGWFGTETMLGKAWGWVSETVGLSEGEVSGGSETETELEAPDVEVTLTERSLEETEVAGGTAKGEGSVKGSSEGLKGEAEVTWESGSGGKVEKRASYSVAGSTLKAKGTLESFEGTRLVAKGSVTTESGELDLEAFDGSRVTAGGKLTLLVGSKKIVKVAGSVGYSVGMGGRLKLTYSFDGGSLVLQSSGDLSAGAGVSWDYSLSLDAGGLLSSIWNSLPTVGGLSEMYENARQSGPITLM